jgi:hypothetical protein
MVDCLKPDGVVRRSLSSSFFFVVFFFCAPGIWDWQVTRTVLFRVHMRVTCQSHMPGAPKKN